MSTPRTRSETWTADDLPDLSGRRIVVTGASSGLGLITTRQLAARGASVVMAVRDLAKGERAASTLRELLPAADLELRALDLLDLDSVRAFADPLAGEERPADVLINNAGIATQPHRLSPQGYESQFATNHLGHFALSLRLMESLTRGTDPRIVTVTSALYPWGRLDLDDLAGERGYSPGRAYVGSKLANALFGVELDRRLRASGSPVRSLLAHPGMARTPMQDNARTPVERLVVAVIGAALGRDAEQGALPLLYAATVPDLPGGSYVGPQRRTGRMRPGPVPLVPPADDPALARRLWDVSERVTGLRLTPVA
ncbi:oxidoreductase [Plantactinospora sp. B5E13]|uniref:oxidoreductase n=1 Tax=Plantactinospora sp. B5E13 TaxID=3153758 RepID=UPI00325D3BCB